MTHNNDGGPAFPQIQQEAFEGGGSSLSIKGGMSLRDWFAGQALAGLIACPNTNGEFEAFARYAYIYADAMLAARATPVSDTAPAGQGGGA